MSKFMKKATPVLLVAVSLLPAHLLAEEKNGDTVDMTSYLCKDLMRMSGEDRSIALAVLHGYALGKRGAVSYVHTELGKVTDDFIEYCLDHPNEKALASFEKLAK